MATARDELTGWPCEKQSDLVVSVYGTNVQDIVKEGFDGHVAVSAADGVTRFCIVSLCEKRFDVVFRYHCACGVKCDLEWEMGKGSCFIGNQVLWGRGQWSKYDETGRLVKWGNSTQFSEYAWMTNQQFVILARLREEWAKKRGLTPEQAEIRAKELMDLASKNIEALSADGLSTCGLQSGIRSLRERRRMREEQIRADEAAKHAADNAARQAAAKERAAREEAANRQREVEREEQRKQMMQIQEELRKARAAREAAREHGIANPSGTNEFGRTWKVQCEYEKFMKENPSGKKAKEEYEALRWGMVSGSVIPAIMSSMVKIPGKDYLIGKTEVTQEIWEKVMGNNPAGFDGPDRPVENVSWNDCQAFVEKLNAASEVKTAKLRFRLPTAEEWEFACRAGGKGDWGKRANGEEGPLDAMGWFAGNSGNETHPVAQKEPNAFGLYDMHGNVWEWTSTAVGADRVDRGGGWYSGSWYCAAGHRDGDFPNFRFNFLGFRLAAS